MRSFSRKSVLPTNIKTILDNALRVIKGGSICILAMLIYVSLFFYSPLDDSLNTSSSLPIMNKLDWPGAVVADLLMQIFGFGAYYLTLILFTLGFFRMRRIDFRISGMGVIYVMLNTFLISIALLLQFSIHGGVFANALGLVIYDILSFANLTSFIPFITLGVVCVSVYLTLLVFGTKPHEFVEMCRKLYEAFIQLLVLTGEGATRLMNLSHIWIQSKRKSYKEPTFDLSYAVQKEDSHPVISGQDLMELSDIISQHQSDLEASAKESHFSTIDDDYAEGDDQPKTSSYQIPDDILFSHTFHLPPVDLLDQVSAASKQKVVSESVLEEQAQQLKTVLEEYGVRGEIANVRPGPVVTMFEFKPAAGIKTARVISLADDIARSMSALSTRIATIPGQNVIGIELPNQQRQTVYIRDMLQSQRYEKANVGLPIILGKDIGGEPIIADLTRMPHLLVAGTTGSGKSVAVNTMILSLLFKLPPDKCKFIMIDPKMLELSVYDDIPHLLTPVVTDPKKAIVALKWAVKEMENRYRAMSKLGVRNIDGYNARIQEAVETGEILSRRVQTGFDPDTGKPIFETQNLNYELIPYIVVVVDEMADLMMVAGKEIEAAVQRLAQMARAAGIHLIMATQRPSVDVITGTIKANFPTRISFQVTSKIDSRTILGEQGAEQLLGQGDMLYMAGGGRISRVHGPFVKDTEVERVVKFLKTQGEPSYVDSIVEEDEDFSEDGQGAGDDEKDVTYRQAVQLIMREGKVSTSFIQRHLSIGYNRAAKIVDQMEKEGIISPANHVGKREILKTA